MSNPLAGAIARSSDWSGVFALDTAAWTNWVPTLTQSSTVTATVSRAVYTRIGRIILFDFVLFVTGTGSASNNVYVSTPVTAAGGFVDMAGWGNVTDTSAGDRFTALMELDTTSRFAFRSTRANGLLGVASFTAALANTDLVRGAGFFEAAS